MQLCMLCIILINKWINVVCISFNFSFFSFCFFCVACVTTFLFSARKKHYYYIFNISRKLIIIKWMTIVTFQNIDHRCMIVFLHLYIYINMSSHFTKTFPHFTVIQPLQKSLHRKIYLTFQNWCFYGNLLTTWTFASK